MLRLLTRLLVRLLPRELRDAHGAEIARDVDSRFGEGRRLSTFTDIAAAVIRERRRPRHALSVPAVAPSMTMRISTMFQDLRFAFRLLLRTPAYTVMAVAALALGIGANAAIFGAVDTVLLRPVPYPHPDRLVVPVSENLGRDIEQGSV